MIYRQRTIAGERLLLIGRKDCGYCVVKTKKNGSGKWVYEKTLCQDLPKRSMGEVFFENYIKLLQNILKIKLELQLLNA